MTNALAHLDQRIEALPDCQSIAREMMSQPEFFSLYRDELPETERTRPVLAAARYTGQRSDDEAINLRVGAMRMLGLSDRAIERECGVDRRTIPHRLAWLEKARRIPAVKDRVLMRTADLAERSALALSVLLDRAQDEVSTDLAAMIKAVATTHGITVEKLQLLTGSPTEIIQEVGAAPREAAESWLRENSIPILATTTPTDSESAANAPKPEQTGPLLAARYAQDTPAVAGLAGATNGAPSGSEPSAGAGGVGAGGAGGEQQLVDGVSKF